MKLLFIAIDNAVLKGSAAILIKAGGILSGTLLETLLNLITAYRQKDRVIISIFFSVIILLIFKILEWLSYELYNINGLFVIMGTRLINVMFIEDFD